MNQLTFLTPTEQKELKHTKLVQAVHAALAPSGSIRWMNCPGSIAMEKQAEERLGPEKQSEWAAAGSAAHNLAEYCLTLERFPAQLLGEKIYTDDHGEHYMVDQAMCDKVLDYVNHCRTFKENGYDVYIESKITLEPAMPVWGTADFVACKPKHLYVCDLKTGHNRVHARDNPQLLIYGIGAWIALNPLYEFETVTVAISQPPLNHYDEFTLTKDELMTFVAKLQVAVKAIDQFPEQRIPGEKQCQWCRARSFCPELAASVTEVTAMVIDTADPTQLSLAMASVPMVKAWIRGVEDAVKERVLNHKPVPGWKSVEGKKSARKWVDEEKVKTYLKGRVKSFQKALCTVKFKTPTQVLKLLESDEVEIKGKSPINLDKHIKQGSGAPTVVKEDDPRPALVAGDRAKADFAQFETGEAS